MKILVKFKFQAAGKELLWLQANTTYPQLSSHARILLQLASQNFHGNGPGTLKKSCPSILIP